MTAPIHPALTPDEWVALEGRPAIERGEEFQGDGIRGHVDEWLGFCVDNFTPETQSSHKNAANLTAIIALANAALPDSDPRQIRFGWVLWLREEAEILGRNGAGAGALMAAEIADALASYLPPEGAT